MDNKRLLLSIILTLFLIFAGCTKPEKTATQQTTEIISCKYSGGTNGLIINLTEGNTIDIFPGESVPFYFEVMNLGEGTAKNVQWTIQGIPYVEEGSGNINPNTLEKGMVGTGEIIFKVPETLDISQTIPGRISVIYDYNTKGLMVLCLRNMRKRVKNPICPQNSVPEICQSSGPIQITNIQLLNYMDKSILKFVISNVGNGMILQKDENRKPYVKIKLYLITPNGIYDLIANKACVGITPISEQQQSQQTTTESGNAESSTQSEQTDQTQSESQSQEETSQTSTEQGTSEESEVYYYKNMLDDCTSDLQCVDILLLDPPESGTEAGCKLKYITGEIAYVKENTEATVGNTDTRYVCKYDPDKKTYFWAPPGSYNALSISKLESPSPLAIKFSGDSTEPNTAWGKVILYEKSSSIIYCTIPQDLLVKRYGLDEEALGVGQRIVLKFEIEYSRYSVSDDIYLVIHGSEEYPS